MSQLIFPLWFKRQYAAPLDVDSVFETEAEMLAYLSSGVRYAGQVVYCKEFEGKIFILNNDRDAWLELSGSGESQGITGAYITTINDVSGAINLVSGDGISVATSGGSITFSVTGDYALNSDLTLLETSLTTLISDTSGSLDTRLVTIESDYLTSSDYAALQSSLSSVSGALQGQINTNISDIGQLQSDLAALPSQLDSRFVNLSGDIMTGDLQVPNLLVTGDTTINGNLYVNGTETIVNTTSISASDNQIVINAGETGPGVTAGYAGIRVDRGSEPSYDFQFRESDDSFVIGISGDYQAVATREDDPISGGYAIWNSDEKRFDTVTAQTLAGTISGFYDYASNSDLDSVDSRLTTVESQLITGSYVSTVNGLSGSVNIVGGDNVSITNNGLDTLTVNVSGISGVTYTNAEPSVIEVGGIEVGTTFNNTTFAQFVDMLLYPELFPTLTAPSRTFTSSETGPREIGEIVASITFTSIFNRGSISPQYESASPFRSGLPNEYIYSGPLVTTSVSSTSLTDSQTITNYEVTPGANNWTGRVAYDGGVQPKGSKGTDFDSPLAPGTTAAITRTLTGVRRYFWGTEENTTVPTISSEIRALSNSNLNASNGTSFTINIPAGAEKVVFAYPSNLRDVDTVKYVEGLNAEVKGVFVQTTISVESANGYDSTNYKVYYYIPAEPFGASATYNVTI